MFGLVDAISAISSRSPSESERVFRLRSVWTKLISLALTAGSACGPIDRLRVSGFGCRAFRDLIRGNVIVAGECQASRHRQRGPERHRLESESLSKLVIVVSSLLRLMAS